MNTVASLAYTDNRTINSGRPLRLYGQVIGKYSDALPVTRQPIQPIRRRGRPSKQSLRVEEHRLLREANQKEIKAEIEEYGLGDLFIDDDQPEVPEWVKSVDR